MNPQSLDSSIQSALSALYPPFEVTAPIVLSQLFRTIEERYHGDALHCLLDFLIPSKHVLESVQQAACASYSDVLFHCEGWPLCLHDKTVVHLAPLNPLLLRPGDFYLQVEPFGDQAARIVLKSLLQEGCREVEETPIPETLYPCIFTLQWLQEVNEDRHGTPLSRCLLSTDQGVIKLPWDKVAIPEFRDQPRTMPTFESPPKPRPVSISPQCSSSTLPIETMVLPPRDRMSLRLGSSSKLIKVEHDKPTPKTRSKPSLKPVGWVSPNTWDSRNYRDIEGDYVDLVDFAKDKETLDKLEDKSNPPPPVLFKPVRPPPPIPVAGSSALCGRSIGGTEEPCTPCGQRKQGSEATEQEDMKCRYRDSYVAALRNPVQFEKGSTDLLATLEEGDFGDSGDLESIGTAAAAGNEIENTHNRCIESSVKHDPQCCEAPLKNPPSHLKEPQACFVSGNPMKELPTVHKLAPGGSHSREGHAKHISHKEGHDVRGISDFSQPVLEFYTPYQIAEVVKPLGKQRTKLRSPSIVSETPKGSPLLSKPQSRSHSDICPEMIPSLVLLKKHHIFKKDCPSDCPKSEDGQDPKPQSSKTDKPLLPSTQLTTPISHQPLSPQSQESSFRSIRDLLQLGIICLPGSRDKTGRAVVEVHGDKNEWMSPPVSAQDVCKLLLYLHSIPRKDVRDLGMTLVIDGRKSPLPAFLYKALLMVQEQALHAVHIILILVDKDTSPRPERQPGLQMDLVTSLKALSKIVEGHQLTSDLGGTFAYSHSDWLQFHQRLVPFLSDLQGADTLLQNAIRKVDGSKKLDTAQDVQLRIEEQRSSMKQVLEDARLVNLQREGGAMLARMRKEEFKFPQSEDYRDALELVTALYNQLEEKLHTLVMRSNMSLQELALLFRIREMDSKISTAGTWFNTEGERRLKESNATDDSLKGAEEALRHFGIFLTEAKDKRNQALALVTEAERIVSSGESSPVTDVFLTVVVTFKSNAEDFLSRAEQRHRSLETLAHVYRFCEQACSLAKECIRDPAQMGHGSPAASRSAAETPEQRLAGVEFSAARFQAVKAQACALGAAAEAPGAMEVWNAAWARCQEARRRLEDGRRRKKKVLDKNGNRPAAATSAAACPGSLGRAGDGEEGSGGVAGLADCPASRESPVGSNCEETQRRGSCAGEGRGGGTSFDTPGQAGGAGAGAGAAGPRSPNAPAPGANTTLALTRNDGGRAETKWKPRVHHSEENLRANPIAQGGRSPCHQALGRSLSEGSCTSACPPSTPLFPGVSDRQGHCQLSGLGPDQRLPVSRNESFCSGHSCCMFVSDSNGEEAESTRGSLLLGESPKDPRQPEQPTTADTSADQASSSDTKLQRIMAELLSTEREYVRALGYVREHYFPELERADVPQDLRGQRGSVFGNLEKLHDFHRHHFLKELEGCVKEPFGVGRCFLRHRESLALYALYSKNKPQSDSLIINHGQAFFKQKQLQLGDQMDLWSYLLKPVQRISKYSLLLQDTAEECGPEQAQERAEILAALEAIRFQLRHGNDLLAMDDIHGCDVNLKEQGHLIRQDEFLVTFRKRKCLRHMFLFQELILFSKTRKTGVANDTYVYKQSFKTSDIGLTHSSGDSGLCFEIWFRRRKSQDTYTLQAASRQVKQAWTADLERILWEQAVHNREARMQERVFMGIGSKPFMDIQPSDAAISDRAVNYAMMGRDNKGVAPVGPRVLLGRHSSGSDRSSSSSGSESSSTSTSTSSGTGSLSPGGYLCGPKPMARVVVGGRGYTEPSPPLQEHDMDHETGGQGLLMESSDSFGVSASCFSSSGHSCRSVEDSGFTSPTPVPAKEGAGEAPPDSSPHACTPNRPMGGPQKTPPPVAPKPHVKTPCLAKDGPCGKVQNSIVGKSTEV